jgi:PleD family two-component response regulator
MFFIKRNIEKKTFLPQERWRSFYLYLFQKNSHLPILMEMSKGKPKIFVVDDDLANRILMSEILEGANVAIIECGCGREAVLLFQKHYADIVLVILDIQLPKCN